MTERRLLVAGVTSAEKEFVYADKRSSGSDPRPPSPSPTSAPREGKGRAMSRVPLTTRIRSDFAIALKRASLERQLQGVEPSAILDILEEALEPWLRTNGYIT